MKFDYSKVTDEMVQALRLAGNPDENIAIPAQRAIAAELMEPLKKGVLDGANHLGIFNSKVFKSGEALEYPVHFIEPGTEREYTAWVGGNQGRIPEKTVQGDFVMARSFSVKASIDTHLRYIRDGRWDIVGDLWTAIEAMFVYKDNTDAWHTLLTSAVGRGFEVIDSGATNGVLSKALVSNLEITMRRRGGGNATSLGRSKLTHLFISPEARADVMSWTLTEAPDALRSAVYNSWSSGGVTKIGPVSLVELDELGVDQPYNDYVIDTLGHALPGSKVEFVVGLDLDKGPKVFKNPIREEMAVFEDKGAHRNQKYSLYGWKDRGYAVLDERATILGAL